jgi:hypothetical protein
MTALRTDITGTTLEIRVIEVGEGSWRWALCAVDTPHPSGVERHRAAWGGTGSSARKAFELAMQARSAVMAGLEPGTPA